MVKLASTRTIQLHYTPKEVVGSYISSYLKTTFPLVCFQVINTLSKILLPKAQYI